MHTLVTSFLGRDCPGVVAAVSSLMEEAHCDIIIVSQTISNGEFAAIFTVVAPSACTVETLHEHLVQGLAKRQVDLSVIVRPAIKNPWCAKVPSSPFVVTAHGPNSTGIMMALSSVFAKYNVNIESLKAIMSEGSDNNAFFLFQVVVPNDVELQNLRNELLEASAKFSLRVSMQHRDIFEAINRIAPI